MNVVLKTGFMALLFLIAHPKVSAEQLMTSPGMWVMLDHNNQGAERQKFIQLAESKGAQWKIFPSVEKWNGWLAENDNSKVEVNTLVVSGHAMGSAFDQGLSVGALSEIAKSNPGVAKTEALYALGCYTATTANARLWARTLPELRYVAGFDESGPSHDPSVQFLEEMERVRPQLGPRRSPEELKADLRRAFTYKNKKGQWPTNAAVGVLDREGEKMTHISRRRGSSVLPFGPPDLDGCRKALSDLESELKPTRSVKTYLSFKYNGGSPPKCGDIKPLAPVNDHSADLRSIYSKMQRLAVCDKDVFLAEASLARRMEEVLDADRNFLDGSSDASVMSDFAITTSFMERRDQMIVFIHQEQILKNFMECAQPFLSALMDRSKACLKDRESLALENAIKRRPVTRQSMCEMWRSMESYGDLKGVSQTMISGLLENLPPWALRDMDLWDPLTSRNKSQVCERLSLNKANVLKALQDRQKPKRSEDGFGRCRALNQIIGEKRMVGKMSADGSHIEDYVETLADWSEVHVERDFFWGFPDSGLRHEGAGLPGLPPPVEHDALDTSGPEGL